MGRQNKELLENIKKLDEKEKVKQQESEILEQRATKRTKSQRKTTIRNYRESVCGIFRKYKLNTIEDG